MDQAPPNNLSLNIPSEIAPLKKVLVHTPGQEISLISPDNKDELLFDDLVYEQTAREEHHIMCRLFGKIIGQETGVLQVTDLLQQAFAVEDARLAFVDQLSRIVPGRNFQLLASELKKFSPTDLLDFAVTGRSKLPLNALPSPNLLFTRDLGAVVGSHVVLGYAARPARSRESLMLRIIFRFHPALQKHQEQIIELPPTVTFEGGDLLVAGPDMVLLGISERTSMGGATCIVQELLEHTPIRHVFLVDIPKMRASMHLDTVFTFTDINECVVFPPLINQRRFNVMHYTSHTSGPPFQATPYPNLKTALQTVTQKSFTFIPCGGKDPLQQKREQWTDGANLFAVAPGVVVGYERNRYTFKALEEYGYETVEAEDFLSFNNEDVLNPNVRLAIKLPGHELSRGRGGARCMTLALARQPQGPYATT